MSRNDILRKFTSRKLWLAIAGVATGIAMMLGVQGSEITDIAGGVLSVLSAFTYIVVEGKVDAERVKSTTEG